VHAGRVRQDHPAGRPAVHPQEAAGLLQEVWKLDLPAQTVAALEARTEGWAVELQLAALQDGAIFQEAATRDRQAWQAAHPGRRAELAGVD
jgi:hypothetical protein